MQYHASPSLLAIIWFCLMFLPCHAGKIHDAVARRDLAALDRVLKSTPGQVNTRCYPDFKTPLRMATGLGDPAMVKRLLEAGADLTMSSVRLGDLTPLQRAVILAREDIVDQKFQESGGSAAAPYDLTPTGGTQTPKGWSFPALPANEKPDRLQVLKLLLATKPNPNKAGANGIPPLHLASGQGDEDVVKLLVAAGADTSARCQAWMTPLHYTAIGTPNPQVIELLIANGADVDAGDRHGQTPLMIAAKMGWADAVETLLAQGAACDARDLYDQSVICYAAGGGHDEIVKRIYQKGGRDLIRFAKAEVLIHTAATSGSVALMGILLDQGVDVNLRDSSGFTPLLSAVEHDQRELVALLLAKGANRSAKTQDEQGLLEIACSAGNLPLVKELLAEVKGSKISPFPLYWAASKGRHEIVPLLIEHGADVNASGSPDGASPLVNAVAGDVSPSGDFSRHPPTEEDRAEIVELLIERGAKVDQESRSGITVAHAAAIKRGARVMKALLQAGAKPDVPTGTQHMTPLLLAAQVGKAETVRVLLNAGADPSALTRQGETVLHVAALNGNTEVVRWLLSNHFAVNEKNKNLGGTPLHYAAIANSLECVELLLAAGAQPNALDKGNVPPLALAINEKIRMEYLASDGIPQAERLRLLAKNMLDRLLIIHRLLAAGARTKLKSGPDEAGNFRELDLVQYAKENGAPEIVELLQNPPAATRKPR